MGRSKYTVIQVDLVGIGGAIIPSSRLTWRGVFGRDNYTVIQVDLEGWGEVII